MRLFKPPASIEKCPELVMRDAHHVGAITISLGWDDIRPTSEIEFSGTRQGMRDIILEVVQITAADSWFIGDELDDGDALIPVAFFALVKSFDLDHPIFGIRAHTIPVPGSEIGETLVGRNLSDFSTLIVHASKLPKDHEA